MPDSISSCGLLTAPPHSTTSRVGPRRVLAAAVPVGSRRWPGRPRPATRVASASVRTVRLGRAPRRLRGRRPRPTTAGPSLQVTW